MSDDARDDQLDGAERELASALRSLIPIASSIDPVSAAFEAGRRSQARVTRLWRRTSAAASLVVVVMLTFSSFPSRRTRTDDPQPAMRVASSPDVTLSEQSVLRLRDAVLDRGWGALPVTHGRGVDRAATVRGML